MNNTLDPVAPFMRVGKKIRKIRVTSLLLASYLIAIGIGTLVLMLPASTVPGSIPFIDALFTATSAVCVTGLIVVDTGTYFTPFGQMVILALIQIGGLGVMTITVTIFIFLRRSISFKQRMAMQDVFAHTPREDIFNLLKSIFWFTALAELIGAALLFIHWSGEYATGKAIYTAVFHAVSAFCNAGFALFPDSFVRYQGDLLLNGTVCGLIIFGGIGFPVVYDLYKAGFQSRGKRFRLSVQTKTVLWTTLILIIVGTWVFWLEEYRFMTAENGRGGKIMTAFFQSVTSRTAGFNTVDIASMSDASLAFMLFLMFFGASPGSCGGGTKTTTLAVLAIFGWHRLRQRRRVNLFKRSIPDETVTRSISLVVLSVTIIAAVFFLLLLTLPQGLAQGVGHGRFLTYLFETVSAFGTVGLSMGVTGELNTGGKSLIIIMMLIGRVGVLTFSYVIAGDGARNGIEYAEENVMIG
ncbi:MAG: TrkH family potassium uptake protein [Desulfococcaceae bacterium]